MRSLRSEISLYLYTGIIWILRLDKVWIFLYDCTVLLESII